MADGEQVSRSTPMERISRARPGDEILPTRYRKKPVEIEAIRWSGTNLKELIDFTGLHESAEKWTWEEYEAVVREKGLKIFSLEGSNFIVTLGDYIIKGVKGEFYACKPDIFWMTYARADQAPPSETGTPYERVLQLTKALEQCVAVAKTWHGDDAFDIYFNHSPEMKLVRNALGKMPDQDEGVQ